MGFRRGCDSVFEEIPFDLVFRSTHASRGNPWMGGFRGPACCHLVDKVDTEGFPFCDEKEDLVVIMLDESVEGRNFHYRCRKHVGKQGKVVGWPAGTPIGLLAREVLAQRVAVL